MLALYALVIVVALVDRARWQLAVSLATGLVLYFAGRRNLLARWPSNSIVSNLGRTSYSLFLVHFPVQVVVLATWVRLGWISETGLVTSLAVAYLASLAVSAIFFETVERPAERLSQKVA